MNVRRMYDSPREPRLPAVQSALQVLRGTIDPSPGVSGHHQGRVAYTPEGGFGRLGKFQAQSGRDTDTGKGADLYWPGKGSGIRGPVEGETPLSEEEVEHGIFEGLI